MPYFTNDEINILQIHIPKTGGSSMENYFSKKFKIPLNNKSLYGFLGNAEKKDKSEINSSLQHVTYNTIMRYKDYFNIKFEGLQIITIVRNPYTRIISDLFFYSRIAPDTDSNTVFKQMQQYLNANVDNHNLPQTKFITVDGKELIPDIKILRTENLNQDMKNLGYLDFDVRVQTNRHQVDYYFKYLNMDSINLINTFYHDDFELLNYPKITQIDELNQHHQSRNITHSEKTL